MSTRRRAFARLGSRAGRPPGDADVPDAGRDVLVPSQAERALQRLVERLAELGLEPKAAKTRIVHLQPGGEGLDFLGFHHRLARSKQRKGRQPVTFLARRPAEEAMRHARERIRELTQFTSKWPMATVVDDLNLFLRGWAAYFGFGHSSRREARPRAEQVDPCGRRVPLPRDAALNV